MPILPPKLGGFLKTMINENTKEIKLNNTVDNTLAKNEKYREKFSYSKLEIYESCSWRYKLIYEDKNFIKIPSIATDFGTLIHFIEESLAKDIGSEGLSEVS